MEKHRVVIYFLLCLHVTTTLGRDARSTGDDETKGSDGDLSELPRCVTVGSTIVHQNKSCLFIASPSDQKRYQDDVSIYENFNTNTNNRGATNTTQRQNEKISRIRGGGGDVTGNENDQGRDRYDDPYDRDGKYWLVPPFLIGAFSVMVVYFIIHCLYAHCYAKPRLNHFGARNPTIILSDMEGLSSSSVQAFTPVVISDGSHSSTELAETQSFIFGPRSDISESVPNSRRPSRRKSSYLQLPTFFNHANRTRPSVSSAGATLETAPSVSGSDPSSARPRPSVCFVPVARTISDPTGGAVRGQEWIPMQGFMFPSSVLPSTASLGVASDTLASDTAPASPVFFIQSMTPPLPTETPPEAKKESTLAPNTGSSKQPNRRTSFRDPESETITIDLPAQDSSTDEN